MGNEGGARVRVSEEYWPLIHEYCRRVKRHFGDRLRAVCLFGSVATGKATSESDIDILVVAEGLPSDVGMRIRETNPIHEGLKGTEAYRLLRKLGRNTLISDLFLTPEEGGRHPPILLDIVEDGIILFERGGYLTRVLGDVRKRLKELGAKRVHTEKGAYWILKPDLKLGEVVEI